MTGSWECRNETDEIPGYSGAVVRHPQLLSGLTLVVAALLTGCSSDPLRVEGRGVLTPTVTVASPSLPAEALRNIRNLDLRSAILADARIPAPLHQALDACARCGIDDPIYIDVTHDDIDDVLVPVYSAQEQIGAVVFTVLDAKPTLAIAVYGPQISLDVAEGDLLLATPVFLAGDPPCCPAGSPVERSYRWTGRTFVPRDPAPPSPPGRLGETVVVTP